MQRGAGGPNDTTIVGVSADAVTQDLREPVAPVFYVPFEQTVSPGPRILRASFFVRTNTGLENLASAVRAAVAQVDPTLPVFALHPMQVIVNESIYTDRLVAALSTAFGLLALVLTAVGLYGVISYLVTRRTAEIGIRMVLGAQPRTIVSMILAEVGFIVIAGGAVGLFGALAAGRAIQSQLFGMSGEDPLVLCAAVLVLAAVALTAACIPAIRASRVEPLTALRHE
jgi:ABC-type antimicrobial peptide transport system permease subunit